MWNNFQYNNSIEMGKYKSKRYFRIWFYTVSHSTLLIRSEKQYSDVDYRINYEDPDTTIDLEFSAVDFISIPKDFDGVEIERKSTKYIFNNNENWFVQAHSCVIGKSSWDYNQGVFSDTNLKYDETIELD